jgi:acyl-CoA reductase-like NAD-dependent aldehyde dehydrogenase
VKGHFIGGVTTDGGESSPNVNPSNLNDIEDRYAVGSAETVDAAVAAARAAFPGWSGATIQARSDILDAAAASIMSQRETLADLLAREEGKTLAEARGEVTRAGQIFRFFAGEAIRLGGEIHPAVRPNVGVEVTREPVGIVGLITPWNFPIAIPAWKIAPALAFGNCVVIKPAELTPGCAWALVDILHKADLPAGVLNLVMGPGSVVGAALARHPQVDAVSFTGSVAVGRAIQTAAIETGKRVQLEMGGKNPLVILDDADLETAVAVAVDGAFYSTGQRCTASSRFIVTDGIHDRFVEAVTARMSALRVDDARAEGVEIGPVVDQRQLDKNIGAIERAALEGGRVVGGEVLERTNPGFYFSPALVTDTRPADWINTEEVFGPIASVIRVADYEEAVAVANDTRFGLSAGICTTSLRHATDFKRRAQAGMVMVNLPTAGVDYHVPFGGRKASSFGPREQGGFAREFYTTVKTAYTRA